ncbi:MAG TPA: POTRA domain-containing protein, partial [Candidatus Kapabacteria bacterium]|nr:POTRA domain-containing protein [Candidatus Kapabacteria bacterium]
MKSQETGLITDIQDNTPSELNNIIFTGNTFFTSSQLLEILSLRTSNFSPGLIFFTRLRKESLKNPYTPKAFTDHLQGVVKSYQESEIRYYNPAIAADDSATILELYNQFGFHRATIQYSFFQDSLSQTNTLRFDINEGIRNTVDTVVYKGLERITQQLKEKIEKIRTVKRDSPFDEAQIKSDIDKVVNLLSNEGYYTVGYDSVLPTVTEISARNTDSITVYFVIGNQLKISDIIIQHDYREQNPVANNLILKMLDIQPGDYYSRTTIQNSLNSLLQLGLFERPSIDTVGLGKMGNDSTIPLRVFLPYRQARELSVSPLANRLAVDNFFNLGIEASFLHRNLGGAAQSLNLFVRYMLQDFQIQIPGQFFNWLNSEIQAGINFSQPLLFSIDRARMGASAQLLYSDRDVRIVITDEFTSPSMRLRSTSLRL